MRPSITIIALLSLVVKIAFSDNVIPVTSYDIDRAIERLCNLTPHHPLRKDPDARAELANLIMRTATEHDLPPFLVTAIIYRESSFLPQSTGSLGELGLMQLMPRWYQKFKQESDTPVGQIRAGCALLRYCVDMCGGTMEGGLAMYVSGKGCSASRGTRRFFVVRNRLRLAHRLKNDY